MEPKNRIIQNQISVIVSADVSNFKELGHLVQEVRVVSGIGGIKIGFRMACYCRQCDL
ncbi:hypothetical protein KKE74_01245 [Patescibacteria group bacterium]|nr:hypothetical protein [Patescibacteria group bacterium]MBU2472640.1 hypothetical protein [Patescibacteria group bacterium]